MLNSARDVPMPPIDGRSSSVLWSPSSSAVVDLTKPKPWPRRLFIVLRRFLGCSSSVSSSSRSSKKVVPSSDESLIRGTCTRRALIQSPRSECCCDSVNRRLSESRHFLGHWSWHSSSDVVAFGDSTQLHPLLVPPRALVFTTSILITITAKQWPYHCFEIQSGLQASGLQLA